MVEKAPTQDKLKVKNWVALANRLHKLHTDGPSGLIYSKDGNKKISITTGFGLHEVPSFTQRCYSATIQIENTEPVFVNVGYDPADPYTGGYFDMSKGKKSWEPKKCLSAPRWVRDAYKTLMELPVGAK